MSGLLVLMNSECKCGCNQPARRNYLPGHDATHVAQLVRALRLNVIGWTQEVILPETVRERYVDRQFNYSREFESIGLRAKFNRAADREWAKITKEVTR